jgi:hypothetical protein
MTTPRSTALHLRVLVPLCSLLVAPAWAARDAPAPRPLSPAERAAVGLAADYLARGPAAWLDRLDPDGWLAEGGRSAAEAEIAARLGPREEAEWTLETPGPTYGPDVAAFSIEYPSGLDEIVVLRLRQQGADWRIAELRATVDPPLARRFDPGATRSAARSVPRTPAGDLRLAVVALAFAAVFAVARRRRAAWVAAAAILALRCGGETRVDPGAAAESRIERPARLGALAPLREGLARGTARADAVDRPSGGATEDPAIAAARSLWKAQALLLDHRLAEAAAILRGQPTPGRVPLVDLLRGRLAAFRLDAKGLGAYDDAIANGLDLDGVRLEALEISGFVDRSETGDVESVLLAEMGSRRAESYFLRAESAAIGEDVEGAEVAFQTGWNLAPLARREVFEDPLLTLLVTRPKLFPLVALGQTAEPRVAGPPRSQPVAFPPGFEVETSGALLRAELAGASLVVPGGAAAAPSDAPVVDAASWDRREADRLLAGVPALAARLHDPAASAEPRLRRRLEKTAQHLAERNRWDELLGLTDPFAAATDPGVQGALRWRAAALLARHRDSEALDLLVRVARSDVEAKRPSPGTLYDLAGLLERGGQYELAERLVHKADRMIPGASNGARVRRLQMKGRLAEAHDEIATPHFRLRYPRGSGERHPRQVAAMLESERERLKRWVPAGAGKPIEVELYPLEDFLQSMAGSVSIIGLYDGVVRVPFADVHSLAPELVAVFSHELTHAMIADATGDQAPHWFQEGLAQHLEMGTASVNPIPALATSGRLIAFANLEPIFEGFSDDQLVELAYGEAAWAINFIESRWGIAGIQRLTRAFAGGATTEEALEQAFGMTPASFGDAAWRWAATAAPPKRELTVQHYDQRFDPYLDRQPGAARDDGPLVGVVGRANPAPAPLANQEQMAAWYGRYRAAVAGAKQLLGKVIGARDDAQRRPELAPACRELAAEISRLGAGPFAAPDKRVEEGLLQVFAEMGAMANECAAGRDDAAREHSARLDAALTEAARRLAPYSLRP